MIWAQIALMAIKLLLDLPAVQDWLKRIFGALARARPLQAAKEAGAVFDALQSKCDQVKTGALTGECPLERLALDLEAKYGP